MLPLTVLQTSIRHGDHISNHDNDQREGLNRTGHNSETDEEDTDEDSSSEDESSVIDNNGSVCATNNSGIADSPNHRDSSQAEVDSFVIVNHEDADPANDPGLRQQAPEASTICTQYSEGIGHSLALADQQNVVAPGSSSIGNLPLHERRGRLRRVGETLRRFVREVSAERPWTALELRRRSRAAARRCRKLVRDRKRDNVAHERK
jgi:hypothetical protein